MSAEQTDPATLPDWMQDYERELAATRDRLAAELATATTAVAHASHLCRQLVKAYDVEVVEGPGRAATATLDQVAIMLAGVRAVTVDVYND